MSRNNLEELTMPPSRLCSYQIVFLSLTVLITSRFLTQARAADGEQPLIAYVGTFSAPLRDTLPTQVDLPPGNGKGIHIFHVDRRTGAMSPAGVLEMGTSPSCLAINADGTGERNAV